MNDLDDSTWLCNFVADCHLPETVQVVDGYESLDSEDLSWCQDDIINLHTLKEVFQVIALDVKGCYFSIPLTCPVKIFEIIPVGCADRYETVEELLVPFPKYVRSLRDIPKSGVASGDIIELLEASRSSQSHNELKCRVMGRPLTIFLSGNQLGPFETLRDASPRCIEDVLNQTRLPTRVRVLAGKAKAFNESNTNPLVRFEGLFVLEQAIKQKVLIVSTLVEKQLRILKMPIDLQITVKRMKLNIRPNVFSQICHLIEHEVDINSTITCGSTGHASWYFDISDDMYEHLPRDNNNEIYEESRPLVPPRTPPLKPLPGESRLNQNRICNKSAEARYAPPPKLKLLGGKPPVPAVQRTGNIMLTAPPRPPAKKPTQSILPKPTTSKTVVRKRNPSGQYVRQINREPDSVPSAEAEGQMPRGITKTAKSTDRLVEKVDVESSANQEEDEGQESTYEAISEVLSKQSGRVVGQVLREGDTLSQGPHQQEDPAGEFPKRLQNISVSEVSVWLRKLGLSQYVKLFVKEAVDGTMLLELDDEMMQCIGIDNVLHRKKLLMFIQRGWTPNLN